MWGKIAAVETIDIFGIDPYWLGMQEDISFLDYSNEALRVCKEYSKICEEKKRTTEANPSKKQRPRSVTNYMIQPPPIGLQG